MKRIKNQDYVATAKKLYHEGGTREVDNDAKVSRAKGNPEHGAYVQCWVWISDEEVRDCLNAKIHKGQPVRFKPEYQDAGDENVVFIAVEDSDGDRVTVEAQLGLPINPRQVVTLNMIAKDESNG